MNETYWKWNLYIFVKASDVTEQMKTDLANIMANNNSGQSYEDEFAMFDSISKFSTSGNLPAQVYGINVPVKNRMRDTFLSYFQSYPDLRYVVFANSKLTNYEDRELVATNFDITPSGQIVTWILAKQYLNNEYGLIEIIED